MKMVAASLHSLVLALVVAGCGGSDRCSEGCNRMRTCAETLNCATLDPLQQLSCNQSKKQLLAYDCSPLATLCPDDVRARFEAAASCTLDPATCLCRAPY